jgi:aldose 1-epimerase
MRLGERRSPQQNGGVTSPTGIQHLLASADGRASARITEVGASLRGLVFDGVDVVAPYPDDIPAPAASGIVLVPWPNRVRDGKWTQRGQTYQLAISEPKYGNASHGLLRFGAYRVAARQDDSITLEAEVFPQSGYPFHLATQVTYALSGMGLTVMHRLENVGDQDAPAALGTHPYLTLGDVPASDLTLHSPADSRYINDDRMLPIDLRPVDAPTDIRTPRTLSELALDTVYTDLHRDADGIARTTLTSGDGRRVTHWQGEGFDFRVLYSNPGYPGRDTAIAVEPMTAPTDALNSGTGLRWLAPGESWELTWGIDYSAASGR